ncbi:Cell wall-binding protein [Candidatus Desulfosporosinus infrequens]|uniref:Cell wall-binding protein n=1 Tax=Candidatus Desulfosporosinus infrequens TaxID=2043169 RepID=A0A2U3LR38_9FIRM|nr:Cell wall-binding protein [Candidatus Desulfosporosinus infrequens]
MIGGLGALSANIETQLASLSISTTRIAGQDRYDTSVQIAKALGTSKGAFVTTGTDFPDAMSAAPIAAAQGMPILLVPPDSLPTTTQNYLNSSKLATLYVINGSNELSNNLVNQLPNAQVITGDDLYERNVNLIEQFSDDLNFDTIYVATGSDYPDALAASALAQKNQAPVILLQTDSVPDPVATLLSSKLINEINIIGGDAAISATVESSLPSLPDQIVSVAPVTDSVTDKTKYQLPKTVGATLTDSSTVQVPVTWTLSTVNTGQTAANNSVTTNNTSNTNTTYIYSGTITDYTGPVTLTLTVNPAVGTVVFDTINAEAVQGYSYAFPSVVSGTLSDNTVQQYPVSWNVSATDTSLYDIGSYTFQGTVAGVSQKVNLTLNVVANAPVNIADGNLAAVVRYQLTGLTYGNSLYLSDVLKITSLVANGKYISDLSGLENFKNLTDLELGYNSLTTAGIAPLKKLTQLKVLILNNNSISSFATLSTLTQLNSLYVTGNTTSDYSPLKAIYKNLVYSDFSV